MRFKPDTTCEVITAPLRLRQTVPAMAVGNFRIHKEVSPTPSKRFTVTPANCPLQIGTFADLRTALEAVSRVESLPDTNWLGIDEDSIFATRKAFRAAYDALRDLRCN